MASGGARVGAGRPRKPLEEKIKDGDIEATGINAEANVLSVEVLEDNMPTVKEYMESQQKDGKPLGADEQLKDIFSWVAKMGCKDHVPTMLLEQYAMNRARWIALQNAISEYGYINRKGSSGNVQVSPFVTALIAIEKQMNTTFFMINSIVKDNCIVGYQNYTPQDNMMEQLLKSRGD